MNYLADHMTPAQRNGGVDTTSAFIAAQDYADHVVVPPGTYIVNDTIQIKPGKTWVFEGAKLQRTVSASAILSAVGVDEWKLLGDLSLIGVNSGSEKGLYVKDAKRWRADAITGKTLKTAVEVDGGGVGGSGFYGQTGQITSLDLWDNDTGLKTSAGAGGEYCVISTIRASGNQQAVDIAAGNTRICGGNISANVDAVRLRSGLNHGHGSISNVSITHNSGVSVLAEDVVYGFLFLGCSIIGDSASVGKVLLNRCSGVTFRAGDLYAVFECNDAVGWCVMEDNRIHGSPSITNRTGNNQYWIMAKGNYVPVGAIPPAAPMWALNTH